MASKTFEGFDRYQKPLHGMIASTISEAVSSLPELSKDATWVMGVVSEYSLSPSKHIRGSLACYMYDMTSGTKFSDASLRLGTALECVQNHLLIIDDVIDRSLVRRSNPTIHERYKSHYSSSEREADMVGVLAGMIPGQLAIDVLLEADVPDYQRNEALKIIMRDLKITELAQVDDIRQQFGRNVSREALLRRHEQKSSYYSFVSPIATGLILGGVKDIATAIKEAEAYGLPAGVAFQLRDDYLGVFGEISRTGKPNFDDMREGKYTLMVHVAEQRATTAEKRRLSEILGNHQSGEKELEDFQTILKNTNADTEAMSVAEDYAQKAIAVAQDAVSWDNETSMTLQQLVEFSIRRHG